MNTYQLLDSGEMKKLERFGPLTLIRPAFQAIWKPQFKELWEKADAHFSREKNVEGWIEKKKLKENWIVEIEEIQFKLKRTPFGHLGVFPEHAATWKWIKEHVSKGKKVLNLFAYTGGATLAAAQTGATVTHLDASKGAVSWARENAALNGLENHPIRWIVDDVTKFLQREKKRNVTYDAIIMDPPTFGRGKAGEVFKIEKDLYELIDLSLSLLSSTPLFFLFSTHTPGYTPLVLEQLLKSMIKLPGKIMSEELMLYGPQNIPSGSFAIWKSS